MKLKTRPGVALLVETSRAYGRELLRGVALFARTRTDWSLLHQEMTLDSAMPGCIASSALSGVIARVDTHTVDPLRGLNVPIVDVRCKRTDRILLRYFAFLFHFRVALRHLFIRL
jgi:LacI family transcriptional regulator